MRLSKRKRAEKTLERRKLRWEELKPKVGNWVCYSVGSDRYGHQIEWVSEDGKELKTEHLHLILNKWYIWVKESEKRMIMYDYFSYNLWGGIDPSYIDPGF